MKKYELEVVQDTNPYSPREDDNLGTMVCFHKRYELGDKTDYRTEDYDSWDELKDKLSEDFKDGVILPLYLYDHSGITISTSSFDCRWDSGCVGFICVSKDKIKEEGIDELNEEHWKVINVLQDYYKKNGIAPMVRILSKLTGFKLKHIYELFPSGPGKGACKMAGLPKPTGCV